MAQAGALVEQTMSALASAFVERGVGSLVVAGGETAGVCVQALGIEQMQIGPQIDPGVPWVLRYYLQIRNRRTPSCTKVG